MDQVSQLRNAWSALPRRAQIAVAGVGVVAIIVMFLVLRAGTSTSWVSVTDGMKADQIGAAESALTEAGIKNKINDANTGIVVPSEQRFLAGGVLLDVGIAASGAHKDCESAFSEGSGFASATSKGHAEKVRSCRQNELKNMIETMPIVDSAMVNLTMGEDQLFTSEETAASASVMVVTGDDKLPSKSVSAIQKSVAASVSELAAADVVVTDDSGRELSSDAESNGQMSMNDVKLRAENMYNANFERKYEQRFEDLVGPGRVQVLSNAELDMDAITQEIRDYGGEENTQGVIASENNEGEVLNGVNATTTGGVAGAGNNIGVDEDNRTTTTATATGTGEGGYVNENIARTYLNDEFASQVTKAPGTVLMNRVAVIVDDSVPAEAANALKNSMQSIMGGQPEDSFSFQQAPFALDDASLAETSRMPMISSILKWVLLGFGLLGLAFVVRRQLTTRTAELLNPPDDLLMLEGGQFEPIPIAEIEAAMAASGMNEGRHRQELQRKVESIADNKPEDVANELRRWLHHDDQAYGQRAVGGR